MINKFKRNKWILFTAITILLTSIFIFHKYLMDGYYFLSKGILSDLLRANLPTYYQMYDSINEGGNFWSWKMGIGTSMFSHADVYFDPFTYILFIFGRNKIPNMMVWLFIIKLISEGISFYCYISYFRIDKRAASVASIAYAFCGYSMIMGSNFALGTILVYMPIVLLGIEKWLDEKKVKILFIGLFLIAICSYYYFFAAGLITILYLVIRETNKRKLINRLISLAGIAVIVILLSSFSILPQIELVLSSSRVNSGKDVTAGMALIIPDLKVLFTSIGRSLSNDLYGNTILGTYKGNTYMSINDYFQISCFTSGTIAILFTQYWHFKKKNRHKIFNIAILLIIMVSFPVVSYIFNAFTTINARWMFIISIAECVLIGFSIDEIIQRKKLHGESLVIGIIISYSMIILSFIILSAGNEDFNVSIKEYLSNAKISLIILLVITIMTVIIYIIQNYCKNMLLKRGLIYAIVLLIILSDEYGNYYNLYCTEKSVSTYSEENKCNYEDTSSIIIKEINSRDKSLFRINKTFDSVYDDYGIPSENDAMVQNYYGLKNYNSLNNPNYIEFLQEMGVYLGLAQSRDAYKSPKDVTGNQLNYIDGVGDRYNLIKYLGVKYYLTDDAAESLPESFALLKTIGNISIYENRDYYPIAFVNSKKMSLDMFKRLPDNQKDYAIMNYTILDDMKESDSNINLEYDDDSNEIRKKQEAFRLKSFREDKITFDIDVDDGAEYLSFSIPYDKNWKVYMDGEKVETKKVNISLLGAKVTSGKHSVVLVYRPLKFYIGIVLSTLTLIVLILLKRNISVFIQAIVNYKWTCIQNLKIDLINSGKNKKIIEGRNSNVELCRIICMLLIIAHHCVLHGGAFNMSYMGKNKIISLFFIPGGKLCFDAFLAMSCWFLVDQRFKMSRFLKIWIQVLFYSCTFAFVSYLMGTQFTIKNWISVLLPITGNSHGFAASYLAFYLLLPFLGYISEKLTKKQARILMILLLYFEVASQAIGWYIGYKQPLSSEILLFVLCYFIALNLKKWSVKICMNKKIMLLIFCGIWFFLWIARYLYILNPDNVFLTFIMSTMCDESSISNLIGGFSLFFVFLGLKERNIPIINKIATGTFGILLMHDHNFFRYVLWEKIIKTDTWYYSDDFLATVIIVTLMIFVIGYFIDRLRYYIIEKPLLGCDKVKQWCDKCDRIFEEEEDAL